MHVGHWEGGDRVASKEILTQTAPSWLHQSRTILFLFSWVKFHFYGYTSFNINKNLSTAEKEKENKIINLK